MPGDLRPCCPHLPGTYWNDLGVHEESRPADKNRYRSEFRYGSFTRNVALPEGVKEEDIKASYKDGVLEVRTPLPETVTAGTEKKKLPITRG